MAHDIETDHECTKPSTGAETSRLGNKLSGFLRRLSPGEWFSAVAAMAACISLVIDCCQDSRLDDLEYRGNRLEYRPVLKVVGTPTIRSFSLQMNRPIRVAELAGANEDTIDVPFDLTLTSDLTIVNQGNAIARMVGRVYTDRDTGGAVIRDILRDPEKRRHLLKVQSANEFFQ